MLSPRRRWTYRLLALSFSVSILLLVELGLRVAGTGYPTSFLVPLADKSGYVTDNYKFAWRFFPKPLARTPQPIVVEKRKPEDTVRIIIFGGSAAMGDPEPAYGLPRMLEVLLKGRFPEHNFEVINCAVTAINSHVVLQIARDCHQLNADAWVIYLGNNEVHGPFGAGTVFGSHDQPLWLNRLTLALKETKIGQAAFALRSDSSNSATPKQWGGLQMFLEQKVRHDDPALDRVYGNFEKNLSAIVKAAGSRTSVVISTVGTNLNEFPPFVSLHRSGMTEQDQESWQRAFQAGCAAQGAERFNEALAEFETAATIEQDYAELEYRQAECLRATGDVRAAANKFKLARDHDALRFRADSRINEIIRSVGASQYLVDAERFLGSLAADGIVGNRHFYEHVHLNFSGNYAVAKLFATALADACDLLDRGPTVIVDEEVWLSEDDCAQALGWTPFHERLTLQDVQGRLQAPPFYEQVHHAERDERIREKLSELSSKLTPELGRKTIAQYRDLIASRPDDWMLKQQLAVLLDSVGDLDGATEQFREIIRLVPNHAESFFRLGALHNRTKKWNEAEAALRKALALRPDFARASNSLGICLSHQARYEASIEQFRHAVEVQPSFAEAYVNWGLVLAKQGKATMALERYTAAVEADANYVPAHTQLGKVLVATNEHLAALPHYQAVVRLRPYEPAAHLNLGLLYWNLGDRPVEAKMSLRNVLKLDPGNQLAQQALRQLEEN